MIPLSTIERLFEAHQLGPVLSVRRPVLGRINELAIVNESIVIRFDNLNLDGTSRYLGEAHAYDRLACAGLPVPSVIAADTSRSVLPHDYLMLSYIEGRTLVETWPRLSTAEREQFAQQAGALLAQMHTHTAEKFGKLSTQTFDTWWGYVSDFYTRFADWWGELGGKDEALLARMAAVLEALRPELESVKTPALCHADYHFENVLHVNEKISGIIDFEWGIYGDPLWDFRVEDEWERACPGSSAHVYSGYGTTLTESQRARVTFYKMLLWFDDAVTTKSEGHHEAVEPLLAKVREQLDRVENLLSLQPSH